MFNLLQQAVDNQRSSSPDGKRTDQKMKEKNKELLDTNRNLSA
jgi:hypothetical protein